MIKIPSGSNHRSGGPRRRARPCRRRAWTPDLVGPGFVAQARGEVGDAADRGVFKAAARNRSGRAWRSRACDAEAEIVAAVAPFPVNWPMVSRISTAIFTARSVVSKLDRRVEQDHHAVAGIAVERAFVLKISSPSARM